MNTIQEYFWFRLPYRRFTRLTYSLRTIKPQLNDLNERRKQLQKEYSALRNVSNKCQECHGLCCKASKPYFSAVDYLIRMFSDKPIDESFSWWKPRSITSVLFDNIKSFLSPSNQINLAARSMCPSLTLNGCALEPEDRPIRCILWMCDDLKKTIPANELRKMGLIARKLSAISSEVAKSFRDPMF